LGGKLCQLLQKKNLLQVGIEYERVIVCRVTRTVQGVKEENTHLQKGLKKEISGGGIKWLGKENGLKKRLFLGSEGGIRNGGPIRIPLQRKRGKRGFLSFFKTARRGGERQP